MDEARGQTLYIRTGFYVRPERTLVVASVLPGVGGRRPALWSSGWSLGIGAGDVRSVAHPDLPRLLSRAFVDGQDLRVMSPEARASWMRTWRPAG